MANGPTNFFTERTLPRNLSEFFSTIPLLGGGGIIPEESRVGRARSAAADVVEGVADIPAAVGEYFFGARPTGTPVEGTVTDAPITAEEEDLFKRGFAAMQDQQNMGTTTKTPPMDTMPQSPAISVTPPSPTMGATPPSPSVKSVGDLIGFRPDVPGQTLTQFMQQGVDPQGRLIGAGTDAFAQASREREARMAQEEAGRRMQEARSRGELGTKEERLTRLAAESQGALSQLEPTQLTYLMGQLGYDITPKEPKPTEEPKLIPLQVKPSEAREAAMDASMAGLQEFATVEQAQASGLPIGTKVIIGGRNAVIT